MNANAKTKVSDKFWKEMYARGFQVTRENGGTAAPDHRQSCVIKQDGYYKISSFYQKEKIMFIPGELFIRTIEKIEGMLNYKLFG